MKIAVAMSGGVDSSVAALLLKEEGHEIIGITADFYSGMDNLCTNTSFFLKNIEDAKKVAEQFDFKHFVLPAEKDFSNIIIDPFCEEYLRGRTPNPCIQCNPRVKFKNLTAFAKDLGCEKIATGHYAVLKNSPEGRYYLSTGIDPDKDQSYFLFMLSQQILKNIMLPLGNFHKNEIQTIALEKGLHAADKPESQEICFIPDDDYPGFIERWKGSSPPAGDIVDKSGNIIGQHRGIHRYTIGQRRGLGIAAPRPLYVVEIDAVNNRIIAGFAEELDRKGLLVKDIHYMKCTSFDNMNVLVKTRSTQKPVAAILKETSDGILVNFEEPQIGITPGQASVFYNTSGDVLGGGITEKSL